MPRTRPRGRSTERTPALHAGSFRSHVRMGAALSALLVTLLATSACSDNRLPQVPVPRDSSSKALPRWYPEAPWSAKDGDSRVLIEGKIVFETDKAEIRPGSEKVLTTLLQFLNEHTEVTRLRVEGHTDSTASDDYNQELSARRSLAVCNWLVDRGIEHTRLLAVGFGESKPMAPNEAAAGRAENRRTEFHVAEVNGRLFQGKDATAGGMALEVPSAEERKKSQAKESAKAEPPKVEPPKTFTPTGDEVKQVGPAPKPFVRPRKDDGT